MIQLRTVLNVADNSGARKILCVQVKGGSFRKVGTVGDVIVGAVREAAPNGNIKKGDVVKEFGYVHPFENHFERGAFPVQRDRFQLRNRGGPRVAAKAPPCPER